MTTKSIKAVTENHGNAKQISKQKTAADASIKGSQYLAIKKLNRNKGMKSKNRMWTSELQLCF